MFKKPNLRRVLVFFVPSFLIVIIIHNLALITFHMKDNLVSLFYVRKDNLTGELKAEIYPIALLYRGQYYDASINADDYADGKTKKESYLVNFKHFFIVDEGYKLGEFNVTKVTPSPFMCSNILTGIGDAKDGAVLTDVFDHMSDSRSSHAKGFDGIDDLDYSLKWTIAVSKINKTLVPPIALSHKDMEKYGADLTKMSSSFLSEYTSEDIDHVKDQIILENLSFFDLNHDGQPEISAKIRKTIQTKTAKGSEQCSTDVVYLNLWVTYNNGNPKVILSLISYEREGSWGRGHDLIGTLDIDGDGIEEVVIRRSEWEVVDFEIYEYRDNKLDKVFQGAGFGC